MCGIALPASLWSNGGRQRHCAAGDVPQGSAASNSPLGFAADMTPGHGSKSGARAELPAPTRRPGVVPHRPPLGRVTLPPCEASSPRSSSSTLCGLGRGSPGCCSTAPATLRMGRAARAARWPVLPDVRRYGTCSDKSDRRVTAALGATARTRHPLGRVHVRRDALIGARMRPGCDPNGRQRCRTSHLLAVEPRLTLGRLLAVCRRFHGLA
jgi:hypothetical protein